MDELAASESLKQGWLLSSVHNPFAELQNALLPLDFQLFNYLFFFCEAEEQAEHGGGAYAVPGLGSLVYCGLKGLEPVLRRIQAHNDLGHPVCANLRGGCWLPAYIVGRLKRLPQLRAVAAVFEKAFAPLDRLPHFLRPCYFEKVFTELYEVAETALLNKLG